MDFTRVLNRRYSTRAYKPDPIENEKLSAILQAAILAPTASNKQPFRIIIINTKDRQAELLSIYPKKWFVQAPLVLCVCGIAGEAWIRRDNRSYLDVDAAIVMDHMILCATSFHLGTCFIAAFDVVNARRVLSIPDEAEPILFTPLGYPADKRGKKIRKDLNQLVCYEHW